MNPTKKKSQAGFTMIEVLVALLVLLIGMSGLLAMHLSGLRATAYSRHASEASVLGEARLEELRIKPPAVLNAAPYTNTAGAVEANLNSQGKAGLGIFRRTSKVTVAAVDGTGNPTILNINVMVEWFERGSENTTLRFNTRVEYDP